MQRPVYDGVLRRLLRRYGEGPRQLRAVRRRLHCEPVLHRHRVRQRHHRQRLRQRHGYGRRRSIPSGQPGGAAIGAALTADCVPPTMILQTSQSAQGVLNPGSDRPITGPGNTFITGGGGYGQSGVAYMETSITPIYLWSDGTTAQIRTREGSRWSPRPSRP